MIININEKKENWSKNLCIAGNTGNEENALRNNVQRNGSGDMSTPPVATEDVISLLLQRQTPVSSSAAESNATKNVDNNPSWWEKN